MIYQASNEDKNAIFSLWRRAYPNIDHALLNFQIKGLNESGKCLVCYEDEQIIASLKWDELIVYIQGKPLICSYIHHIATLPDYRRRGYMKQLMNSAIDELENNHLISFVKAFNPRLYERYGFNVVYERKKFHIRSEALKGIRAKRVGNNAQAMELLNLYRQFIAYFDGYFARTLSDYEHMLEAISLGLKKLAVYRNRDGVVSGYVVYTIHKNIVEVEEAIYLDSNGLKYMLKYIMGLNKLIVLEVSDKERIERIFPLAVVKRSAYMMARINQMNLYRKLYNNDVKSVEEAYALILKPKWCHETI